MNDSTDLSVEPGPAHASPDTSGGVRSTRVRFSVLRHQYDAHPIVHECGWHELVSSMSAYDYRKDKAWGPLVSPAEFFADKSSEPCTCKECLSQSPAGLTAQIRKRKTCVGPVSFLPLDFDDVAPEQVIAVLNLVDSLNLSAFAYSTWKQPQAAMQDPPRARVRLFILIDRRVQPEAWPAFYRASVGRFNASMADDTADEPTRFYFTPALPIGCESHAQWWTSAGYNDGTGVAWGVDEVLRSAPAPEASAIVSKGNDPIDRSVLSALATNLQKRQNPQDARIGRLIREGLSGHEIAVKGERHVALRDMAWRLGRTFPTVSAPAMAEHFRLSLDLMREAGTDEDPVKHFCGLIETAQAKVELEQRERDVAHRNQELSSLRLAWASLGIDRSAPYSPEEIRELESVAPLSRRHVLQCGKLYYVHLAGEYRGPLVRDELGVACAQLLAPASTLGVTVYARDEQGNVEFKRADRLVREYGQHLSGVEFDLTGRPSRIERGTLVQRACPLRELEPTFYPEVDEWLRLLGGRKAEALLDWIAVVTWLSSPAPALYLKGDAGVGKTLLALGLARLWTASKPTPLKHALADFNNELLRCPFVFADEKVPESWHGQPRTEELRELITASEHTINGKFRNLETARGAVRVLLAANNLKLISSREDLTLEDATALADRILFVVPDAKARGWLEARGGRPFTESFVAGDRIARHALWLQEQARSGARPVTQGKRLLLPGNADELTHKIMVGGGLNWRVLSWVHAFLLDPAKHVAARAGKPFAAVVRENGVWLAPTLLLESWDHYMAGERAPTREELSGALRSLLVPASEQRYRPAVGGGKVSYQLVRGEQLRAWADTEGVDAGELAAALAANTETVSELRVG